jgi:hypothetical protein
MDKVNGPERGLQVRCANCGAVFMAYYGVREETVDVVETRSCGMCHVEPSGRMDFDHARVRMVAQILSQDSVISKMCGRK